MFWKRQAKWLIIAPLYPSKKDVEVLTLVTVECDLTWKEGLYKGNEVKMKLLGWTLIEYD